MRRNLALIIVLPFLTGCGDSAPTMTCVQLMELVGQVNSQLDQGEGRIMTALGASRSSNDDLCALVRSNIKVSDAYASAYKANKDRCEPTYQSTIMGGLNINAALSREMVKQGLCK